MMHEQLFTSGQIAEQVKLPFTQVAYLIRTRGIAPVMKVGAVRLFGSEAIEQVRAIRRQMDETRRKRKEHRQAAVS
jgi:hypothetical protein